MTEPYEFYSVKKKGHVAWVYLNRTDKKNAMNPPGWYELIPIFDDIDKDDQIRVAVLAANGDTFCAGIDLMAMVSEFPELVETNQSGGIKHKLLRKIVLFQETISSIEKCAKPVIAAVHGPCIGAGLDMISTCDIRLCSAEATFSLREALVGIVADVGVLQRLPNIVGQGITRELAFTAKTIDAERAREILLVNQVLPDREALHKAVQDLAEEIASASPLAVQGAKNVLNHGVGSTVDNGLKYVASLSANTIPSADLLEAMTAFVEKRKPSFTGK